jgi:hypothetical protein
MGWKGQKRRVEDREEDRDMDERKDREEDRDMEDRDMRV